MVEEAIASAPSKLFLAGRIPENDIILESNRVGLTTFGEGINVRDPYTGELRAPTKKDVANAAKLADAMDEIDVYERAVGAHEVPQAVAQLHNAEASFNNTSKHLFLGPFDGFQLDKIVEMATAIAGSREKLLERPLVTFVTCPVSPLKLVKDTCEVIMGAARSGMAVNILSMAMASGSSPVTLAGTLVNHNAEVLSGIVLSQLTCKGAKVIYGSSTTAMDLRLASASVGSPECAMISGAVARLARYYALPNFVAGG
jgi:trimethylamine--corrinoid protein Co-methyltransferase